VKPSDYGLALHRVHVWLAEELDRLRFRPPFILLSLGLFGLAFAFGQYFRQLSAQSIETLQSEIYDEIEMELVREHLLNAKWAFRPLFEAEEQIDGSGVKRESRILSTFL